VRDLFERKSFTIPNADSDLYWITIGWPQRLGKAADDANTELNSGKVIC
jgi:hypothetical protein